MARFYFSIYSVVTGNLRYSIACTKAENRRPPRVVLWCVTPSAAEQEQCFAERIQTQLPLDNFALEPAAFRDSHLPAMRFAIRFSPCKYTNSTSALPTARLQESFRCTAPEEATGDSNMHQAWWQSTQSLIQCNHLAGVRFFAWRLHFRVIVAILKRVS